MTPDRPQKIKLLRLLDLLQRESDVDHPISRQDLCKRLNDMGISSKTFFGWLAQFGSEMKIIKPDSVKDQYANHIAEILSGGKTDGNKAQ